MAILNDLYCNDKSNSLYSDGEIEDELLYMAKTGGEMTDDESRWPVIYHFSRLRQNILNWYPFNTDSTILEIGSGCGALTGLLCSKASKVVSCELTYKRALINYERNKEHDNLEIVVGDFLSIPLNEKFDYIVVCGCLEYAGGILASEKQPYEKFLKYACDLLKNSGRLLLAIENRLGIKYFAGAPEDHLNSLFAGINGYENNKNVKTFSKEELLMLAQNAGFATSKCYYPFPDYKFPSEILTDETINKIVPESLDYPLYDAPRFAFFSEKRFFEVLQKERIADVFSNSFLFEFGKSENTEFDYSPDYVKISNNRRREYAQVTEIYEKKGLVRKKPLYLEGENHLKKIADRGWSCGLLKGIPLYWDKFALSTKYVHGESLKQRLEKSAKEHDNAGIWREIDFLRENLEANETISEPDQDFSVVFGHKRTDCKLHWINSPNIDLISDNILFENDNEAIVIDCEWSFDFCIPYEYILWRLMIQLSVIPEFEEYFTRDSIVDYLGITQDAFDVFCEWERHFAYNYVGFKDCSKWFKGVYGCNFQDILSERLSNEVITSQLFVFKGEKEEPSIYTSEARGKNGVFSVSFKIEEKSYQAVRWDPIEGYPCIISDLIYSNCSIRPLNSERDEDDEHSFVFRTFDPQFLIENVASESVPIEFSFKVEKIDWKKCYLKRLSEIDYLLDECNHIAAENKKISEEKDRRDNEVNVIINQLNAKKQELRAQLKALGSDNLSLQDTIDKYIKNEDFQKRTNETLLSNNLRLNQELFRINDYCSKHCIKAAIKVLLKKRI